MDRLSVDWQERYDHPVVLVETFVDPEQFCGTVYRANGWQELGATDGLPDPRVCAGDKPFWPLRTLFMEQADIIASDRFSSRR